MLSLVLVFLSLIIGAASASAQEVTVNSGFHSMYLGQQGGIFYGKPVSQSDVSIAWDHVFIDVWTSTGFNSRKSWDKETDVTVGYTNQLGKLAYNADFAYFAVQGIDVANLNVELGLGPAFVRAEHYQPTQAGGPGKGTILSSGLKLEGTLLNRFKRVGLSMSQLVKHDSGAFGYREAWLYQGEYGVSIGVCPSTSINAGMRFSVPFKRYDERKQEIAWQLGISRSFGK